MNKYRAWDLEDKKMKEVTCIDFFHEFVEYDNGAIERQFRDVIVMQSTGIKGYMGDSYNDHEEKEVHKDDVIDIFWEEWPAGYYQENHMVGVVDLDETGTAWIIKNAKYDFDNSEPIPNKIGDMEISRSIPDEEDLKEIFLHNFNLTSDDITILGNIHENHELLKEV